MATVHQIESAGFASLIDFDTSCFKVELTTIAARNALQQVNSGVAATMDAIKSATTFSSTKSLCYGGSILYAFFDKKKCLQSIWEGPACTLASAAVDIIADFKSGANGKTIRLTYDTYDGQGQPEPEPTTLEIGNQGMLVRGADLALAGVAPIVGGRNGGWGEFPHTAAVAPYTVTKFPRFATNDADEHTRRTSKYLETVHSSHNMHLMNTRDGLAVPYAMHVLMAGAPLFPLMLCTCPNVLSQGLCKVATFCAAARQVTAFACQLRAKAAALILCGERTTDMPDFFSDRKWLLTLLLDAWSTRVTDGAKAKPASHLALVCLCMHDVLRKRGTGSIDGIRTESNALVVACWYSGVFLTMTMVKGTAIYGANARQKLIADAMAVAHGVDDISESPHGFSWVKDMFSTLSKVSNAGVCKMPDPTNVTAAWKEIRARQILHDATQVSGMIRAMVRLAHEHALVEIHDMCPEAVEAWELREIVPEPTGAPMPKPTEDEVSDTGGRPTRTRAKRSIYDAPGACATRKRSRSGAKAATVTPDASMPMDSVQMRQGTSIEEAVIMAKVHAGVGPPSTPDADAGARNIDRLSKDASILIQVAEKMAQLRRAKPLDDDALKSLFVSALCAFDEKAAAGV